MNTTSVAERSQSFLLRLACSEDCAPLKSEGCAMYEQLLDQLQADPQAENCPDLIITVFSLLQQMGNKRGLDSESVRALANRAIEVIQSSKIDETDTDLAQFLEQQQELFRSNAKK